MCNLSAEPQSANTLLNTPEDKALPNSSFVVFYLKHTSAKSGYMWVRKRIDFTD